MDIYGIITIIQLRREYTTSYYAYTLGRPSDCLTRIARISSQISEHLSERPSSHAPPAASTATLGETEAGTAKTWAKIEALRSLCLWGIHIP